MNSGKLQWHLLSTQQDKDAVHIRIPFVVTDDEYMRRNRNRFALDIEAAIQITLRRKGLSVGKLPASMMFHYDGPTHQHAITYTVHGLEPQELINLLGHGAAMMCKRVVKRQKQNRYKSGDMTEYGWYDSEIESEIQNTMLISDMDREDAIVQVFNEA